MNRVTKIFLGAGIFLVLAGGLLALTGWGMGGQTELETTWNGYPVYIGSSGVRSRGEPVGRGTSDGAENMEAFDTIEVDLDLGNIFIAEGEHYAVELEWRGKNYELKYTNENGTLKVWNSSPHRVNIAGFDNYDSTATIYVPAGTVLKKVDVNASMGDVTLTDLRADTLYADNDLGDIVLGSVAADNMELTVSMGVISADDLTVTKQLDASNDMGDIDLAGDLRGKLDMSCSMGDIDINTSASVSDFGYDLSVDLGEITVDGEHFRDKATRSGGTHHLEAENDMGDITVTFG